MLYQYVHHKFDEKVRPTIGCDFSTKLKSSVDGKPVRLQLWDIAGQERFSSVSKMYLRGALGKEISIKAASSCARQSTSTPYRRPSSGRASSTRTQKPAAMRTSPAFWSKTNQTSSIWNPPKNIKPKNTSINLQKPMDLLPPCSAQPSRIKTLKKSFKICSVWGA